MAETSTIEWTDATWNPITGCTLVSEGCRNCYAAKLAATRMKSHPSRAGLARMNAEGVAKFTGEVRFNRQWLDQPLRWKTPRMVFVCAHGDLFHESVPDAWIDQVFAVMALAPRHTFQVLTKRPERMRDYVLADRCDLINAEAAQFSNWDAMPELDAGPLANVWLGTSVEDRATYQERWAHVAATPAAVRWLSAEPLLGDLGDLDLGRVGAPEWIVVGGESGAYARPMHPDWARSLRDQCAAAGVPFLFKQWGEWLEIDGIKCRPAHLPKGVSTFARGPDVRWLKLDGTVLELNDRMARHCSVWGTDSLIKRVGKKRAGRLLDGRTHDSFPEADRPSGPLAGSAPGEAGGAREKQR